jgi:hypothetical protein
VNDTKRILVTAKSLIDTPGKWTKGQMSKYNPDIAGYSFCSAGALEVAGKMIEGELWFPFLHNIELAKSEARTVMSLVTGETYLVEFNDNAERTHGEVMAAFDKAIASA